MICPNCGAVEADNVKFCGHCGRKIVASPSQSKPSRSTSSPIKNKSHKLRDIGIAVIVVILALSAAIILFSSPNVVAGPPNIKIASSTSSPTMKFFASKETSNSTNYKNFSFPINFTGDYSIGISSHGGSGQGTGVFAAYVGTGSGSAYTLFSGSVTGITSCGTVIGPTVIGGCSPTNYGSTAFLGQFFQGQTLTGQVQCFSNIVSPNVTYTDTWTTTNDCAKIGGPTVFLVDQPCSAIYSSLDVTLTNSGGEGYANIAISANGAQLFTKQLYVASHSSVTYNEVYPFSCSSTPPALKASLVSAGTTQTYQTFNSTSVVILTRPLELTTSGQTTLLDYAGDNYTVSPNHYVDYNFTLSSASYLTGTFISSGAGVGIYILSPDAFNTFVAYGTPPTNYYSAPQGNGGILNNVLLNPGSYYLVFYNPQTSSLSFSVPPSGVPGHVSYSSNFVFTSSCQTVTIGKQGTSSSIPPDRELVMNLGPAPCAGIVTGSLSTSGDVSVFVLSASQYSQYTSQYGIVSVGAQGAQNSTNIGSDNQFYQLPIPASYISWSNSTSVNIRQALTSGSIYYIVAVNMSPPG